MPSSEKSSELSRLAILADRDFRRFFLGNAVSRIGDSPIPVAFAIATYQIAEQAGGGSQLSCSRYGAPACSW
jgi:hypothetical protein